jgi:hypothetical protein
MGIIICVTSKTFCAWRLFKHRRNVASSAFGLCMRSVERMPGIGVMLELQVNPP